MVFLLGNVLSWKLIDHYEYHKHNKPKSGVPTPFNTKDLVGHHSPIVKWPEFCLKQRKESGFARTHAHTCTHTHAHARTHAHTHTHTHVH